MTDTGFDISFDEYRLENGLRVVLHHNPQTPQVAVGVWYKVGAKDELPGKTGLAHLFEHLMFSGSQNLPGAYLNHLLAAGASQLNGTTNHDRTHYFETVPAGALDYTLFAESDRMGHFLGALDQQALDLQRGVVLNEKTQRESAPYAILDQHQARACFPAGHPYARSVLGEQADLHSISLADAHHWFSQHYTPDNAILVLVGAFEPHNVRALIQRHFGAITPRCQGPRATLSFPLPTHPAGPRYHHVQEAAPLACLRLVWNLPPIGHRQTCELELLAQILGGSPGSRLPQRLIRHQPLAHSVEVKVDSGLLASQFSINLLARPGVALDTLEQQVADELQQVQEQGPTPAELQRAQAMLASAFIERHASNHGIANLLASSLGLLGRADGYQHVLQHQRQATPGSLQAAQRQWLGSGGQVLRLTPPASPSVSDRPPITRRSIPRLQAAGLPPAEPLQRARLSNGLQVILVERHRHPLVQVHLLLASGSQDDAPAQRGLSQLHHRLLEQSPTATRDAPAFDEALQDLGARLEISNTLEGSQVSLRCRTTVLAQAIARLAERLLQTRLQESELANVLQRQHLQIQQERAQADQHSTRLLPGLLYPSGHPYAQPLSGSGTRHGLSNLGVADLQQRQQSWLGSEDQVLIIGDTCLRELLPLLEQHLGDWPGQPLEKPRLTDAVVPRPPCLALLDHPGARQSLITAASLVAPPSPRDAAAFAAVHEILANGFGSRLNMSLREHHHWTYGVRGLLSTHSGPRLHGLQVAVQADRTLDAVDEIRQQWHAILTHDPVQADELERFKQGELLRLGSQGENLDRLAASLIPLIRHGLPDDHWQQHARRIEQLTLDAVRACAQEHLDSQRLSWIVAADLQPLAVPLHALQLAEPWLAGDDEERLYR